MPFAHWFFAVLSVQNELLPTTVEELGRLGLSPREVALDGGFQTNASAEALAPLAPERTFITGRASPGSKRTRRRLARYRVGAEGPTSHPKRRHGLRRSRLNGGQGERTPSGWAVSADNTETYRRYARAARNDSHRTQRLKAVLLTPVAVWFAFRVLIHLELTPIMIGEFQPARA